MTDDEFKDRIVNVLEELSKVDQTKMTDAERREFKRKKERMCHMAILANNIAGLQKKKD